MRDHFSMRPPLPEEVVSTVISFYSQYQETLRRETQTNMGQEEVAKELLSVVFEHGYGNVLDSTPAKD